MAVECSDLSTPTYSFASSMGVGRNGSTFTVAGGNAIPPAGPPAGARLHPNAAMAATAAATLCNRICLLGSLLAGLTAGPGRFELTSSTREQTDQRDTQFLLLTPIIQLLQFD